MQESEFGPQYSKDPPFSARMRFHQSWYRAKVLKVPYGVGPKVNNKTCYGNLLTLADGEKGGNFLRPHIFEIAKRRIAEGKGTVDRFRLLCNMLLSQAEQPNVQELVGSPARGSRFCDRHPFLYSAG